MTHMLVDAHEDIAWNVLNFGRDYTRPVAETRQREAGGSAPQHNGDTLLGWDAYQQGNVAIVFGTLFISPSRAAMGDWDNQAYTNTAQARRNAMSQLDVYRRLADEHSEKFCLIRSQKELEKHLALWQRPAPAAGRPLGIVPLMENAEGEQGPDDLAEWWELGLRIIGPAWSGTRFCGGTHEPGALTKEGYALLEAMSDLGFTLDLSHMDRQAALQALDYYEGPIIASHANPLRMLKGSESNRHLSDDVIDGILRAMVLLGWCRITLF